ncbi:DUF6090 family protein [Winogradskyella sp. MIT101101]|uniref:DUF6090 family protein n=1 Tax=Winogradskyella sp. MIT101101 TaxID=3098297 RepID=UPI00399B0FE5
MIKFFRRIRYNLMNQGKTTKYFKYAIGEIILVVIGILIALQINTQNEYRKDRVYEIQALTEIYTSLKRDAQNNDNIMTNVKRRDNAINYILSFLNSGKIETDSVFMYNLNQSCLDNKINYDKGAYETLKSKGLEYIKNDSLRSLIVRTYELSFPRTEFFGDEKRSDLVFEKKGMLLEKLLDLDIVAQDKTFFISESVTLNTTEKRTALKRLMYQQIQLSRRYKELLNRQLIYINRLLTPLGKELQKSET